jgi:hypothetical protein
VTTRLGTASVLVIAALTGAVAAVAGAPLP